MVFQPLLRLCGGLNNPELEMEKSLIDKLKEVIEQHHKENGERVESVRFVWARGITPKNDCLIETKVSIEK